MAGRYDIRLKRGDTWPQTKFIFQFAGGAPRSLVGASALLQVRQSEDGAVLRQLSIGSGFTVTGTSSNELTVAAATPGGLDAGTFVYDLQMTWQDLTIDTPFGGQVIVTPDISQ
jgi:hypothetical protein